MRKRSKRFLAMTLALLTVASSLAGCASSGFYADVTDSADDTQEAVIVEDESSVEETIVINAPAPEQKPETTTNTSSSASVPSTGSSNSLTTTNKIDSVQMANSATPAELEVGTDNDTLPNANKGGVSGNDIILDTEESELMELTLEENGIATLAASAPSNVTEVYASFNTGGYVVVETNKTHIDTGKREHIAYNLNRDSETNFSVTRTVNGMSASAYTVQDSGAVQFRSLMPEQWDFQTGEAISIKVDAEHGFFVNHVKVTETSPTGEVMYEFKSDNSRPTGLNTISLNNRGKDLYVQVEFTSYSFSDRGDVKFNIQPDDPSTGSYIIPFVLINTTTNEKHLVVTDRTGNYNSHNSYRLHSINTNGDDSWVNEWMKDNGVVVEINTLHPDYGTWFEQSAVGREIVQNNKGALPVGNYLLQEIRCAYNSDSKLIQRSFTVEREGQIVDLGSITQETIVGAPVVNTQLLDYTSLTHSASGETTVSLYDRVHLANIEPNHFYDILVELYESDGITRVYTTKNGTSSNPRTYVKGHKEINSGEVHQNYATFDIPLTPFDGEDYIGKNLIAKVTVSDNGHYTGDKAIIHWNKTNISEMIWIPKIDQTYLFDNVTRDHVGANVNVRDEDYLTITDTINYSYLAPYDAMTLVSEISNGNANLQTYLAEGQLYDLETGELLATATPVEFTTSSLSSPDGAVDIQYRIHGDLSGRSVRSCVTISADNGTVLATHNKVNHPVDTEEEVHYLNVITEAGSEATGHVGVVAESAKETVPVSDSVRIDNLIVGEEYVIKGTLRYADTGEEVTNDGVYIRPEVTFTAAQNSERHEVVFDVATADLASRTVVAYEEVWHMSKHSGSGARLVLVAIHKDLTDETQAIHFPEITTKAVDANTLDEVGKAGDTKLIDTVSYSNLVPGQRYEIRGTLMDADTGEYLGKEKGLAQCNASTSFIPSEPEGEIQLTYILDATTLQGHTTVVYENLLVNNVIVRHHETITDLNQTIYFPKVVTEAIASSGLKEQLAYGSQMLFDSVDLTNLVVGKEYNVIGTLYDKTTGKPYVCNGKTVTTESGMFTAASKTDKKTLQFNIPDAGNLENHTLVVFETLVHNGIEVALHNDINDFKQSVKYPKLTTSAVDAETGLDEGIGDNDASIIDTVTYANVEDGATYTIMGTLYNKESGVPYKTPEGYVLASTTFEAKKGKAEVISQSMEYVEDLDTLKGILAGSASSETDLGKTKSENVVSGTVELAFNNFDATDLLGYTAVCYDYLMRDGVVVAKHDDIDDTNQDVKYPKTTTYAVDAKTGTQESNYGDTKVIDTVLFENVTPGYSYKLVTDVVDKATGETLVINNVPVQVETSYTAKSRDEVITVEIPFDTSDLEGMSYEVFEHLYRSDKLVSVHDDLEDEAQAVYLPSVETKAYDSRSLTNEGIARPESVFVDEVYYSNLTLGEEYTIVGYLYDKTTNEKLVIDDEEVSASVDFIGGQDESSEVKQYAPDAPEVLSGDRADGMIHVAFEFDATTVEGKDLVAVQYIYNKNGAIVGHSNNLNDEDEIINYPYVRTSLVDGVSARHDSQQKEETTLVDTVTYRNLRVGNSYTIVGILMDKTTEDMLLIDDAPIMATTTITAEQRDGKVDLTYVFDSTELDNVDVVAYEYLVQGEYNYGVTPITMGAIEEDSYADDDMGVFVDEDLAGSRLVGAHDDLYDDAQRVAMIKLVSEALDIKTGTHESESSAEAVVVNTVNYQNLYGVGETYVLKGVLINKATGEVVSVKSETEEQMITLEFVPEKRSGSIDMIFPIDSTDLKNNDVVAYVRLFKDGKEVARYEDLDELLETVHIPEMWAELITFDPEDHEGNAVNTYKVVNNISYSNLTYGEKYVAEVVLYDAETGLPFDGKAIVNEVGLPDEDLDADTSVSGNEGIATLSDDSEEVAVGDATEDEADTPSVSGNDTVVDTPVVTVSEENAVVAYREFYAGRNSLWGGAVTFIRDLIGLEPNQEKRADGIIALDFEFDATAAAGKDLVAYTRIYRADTKEDVSENMIVARVEERENSEQTISFPKLETVMVDASGSHTSTISTQSAFKDTVTYTNLIPGEEYTLVGTLMNKATGQPVKVGDTVIRAQMKFTPSDKNGSVVMPFNWNSNYLVNNSVVAYEVLEREGFTRASHENINDANQTVALVAPPRRGGGSSAPAMGISTEALDKLTQTHVVTPGKATVIQDTIKYWGLTAGYEYTVRTTVWNLTKDVHIFGVENKFTAGKDYETWTVEMPMNTAGMEGDTIVIYQNIYDKNDKHLVGHSNKEDENQQLTIPLNPSPTLATTGDVLFLVAVIGVLVAIVGGAFYMNKKKKSEKDTSEDSKE